MRALRKLLIANRGEIARRIRRTASEMGIRTVAVYTSDERAAPHALEADEAVRLEGHGPAAYLDAAALIAAARRTGADAVHPGYGFLAENAAFGHAVIEAGLLWVGPPPDAIARMGDKLEAKRAAKDAGVPVLEAAEGELPVLVKAAAGGGGKGMRVVRDASELDAAMAAARREAERSFGDGTLFLEPYLEPVRHVEIQVLADGHGTVVHLGERECSIQRRHQKVVEEAPSPVVDPALRERMGDAALSLARAIGYRNAGTVEFLLGADGRFFFIEMNTRLQVEHPVTEAVWGVDLVRQQLLDAAGDELDVPASGPSGHAIEVRLNAEDPANDFLPETGRLVGWLPSTDPFVRVDSAVEEGSVVGTSFDPMLAKFIASGETRADAALSLALALERSMIQGVRTNRDLLAALLRHEEFLSANTTTDFLERVELPARRALSEAERAAVFAAVALSGEMRSRAGARVLATLPSGWRNSEMPPQQRILVLGDDEVTVSYTRSRDGGARIDTGSGERPATLVIGDLEDGIEVDGVLHPVSVARVEEGWWVHGPWGDVRVGERSPFPSSGVEEASGSLVAPMPGSVVSVEIAVGDGVRKGQTLVVLEAMKMEHPIFSPEDGTVTEVRVAPGEQVERGALLVVVEGDDAGPRPAAAPVDRR